MTQELIITRGLPASGKTTYALDWIRAAPELRVRTNRDEMRAALYGEYVLPYHQEQTVTVAQQAAVRALLRAGKSVIVDDTHLRPKYVKPWFEMAQSLNVFAKTLDFDHVTIEECIERDKRRGLQGHRTVGEDVIRRMAKSFSRGKLLPVGAETPLPPAPRRYTGPTTQQYMDAWLVDIDGTLALMGDRSPYAWEDVGVDTPNAPVVKIVNNLQSNHFIILLSGRDESCRLETVAWLDRYRIPYDELLMRPAGDNRKDAIVKQELFWEHVAHRYNVVGVFDDRQQVVDMWRSLGLMCAQVAPGDF